jgi:anti-sigma B factor antagonist
VSAAASGGESYVVVTLTGEVDATTAGQLRDVLEARAPSGTRRLIVDLSGLEFMDSMGMHVLMRVHRTLEERGGWLSLVAPQHAVMRLLRLSGVEQAIPIYDSISEAVAE